MGRALSFVGLLCTLIGACLLFRYGFPSKKFGAVQVIGMQILTYDDHVGPSAEEQWPQISRFQLRAARYNRIGFGLVALGTFLQMAAVLVPGS